MCGIVAVLNFDRAAVDPRRLRAMRDTLHHRGPDDEGLFVEGPIGLGHRRLSIIDISENGRQPMPNEDGSLQLVFNGEIYNYLELAQDLKAKGHRFSSTSDTEVIVHQYEEDGEECVTRFNGMFSFVLWDRRRRRLFAARDRMGIKNLYYYLTPKKLILASEIKAILEDPDVERAVDPQALIDYAFCGRALGGKTMFRNIREVEPGHMLSMDLESGRPLIKKYWGLRHNYNRSRSDEAVKEELFYLLDESVKIQCRSDASLGCHLSGGLDSSTVTALASRHRPGLKTFSIGFAEDGFVDETLLARTVARHVGAEYCESKPDAMDLAKRLPYLLWHMDVPMATQGGFAYFTTSQLARHHVKVTLTGHGGDELFAGYPAQFQASFGRTDMFGQVKYTQQVSRSPLDQSLIGKLLSRGVTGLAQSLRQRIFKPEKTFKDLWVELHCDQGPGAFTTDFTASLRGYSPVDDYLKPFLEADTDEVLDQCLYHDQRVYLPSLLLLEDRVSMALSIESRVPFLDNRIVEFLATVPPEQKVRGLEPKHLLRQVAAKLLPKEVWARKDKCNFPVPDNFWRSQVMKDLTEEILIGPESISRGIFQPDVLRRACQYGDLTWALVNVELWFKIFVDQDSNWTNRILNPPPVSPERDDQYRRLWAVK
ncbi:MAG: asparagine synthase (glutamine-hydrolyzing) [Nitrospira sp. CG24E]|nr:MAG: asparagine synthase (glutamine-hydrolyzing) [Nitrospira sp. CG24E]